MPLRSDLNVIADLIPEESSVLDLGCGRGDLMALLRDRRRAEVCGVEIDQEGVIACVEQGLPVFQGNLDEGLADYGDGSFDTVVLSQTLQVVHRADFLMDEMLRVGKRAIVSFPNFTYWRLRLGSLVSGRAPKGGILPYEWYESPNIRFLSVRDFRSFCRDRGIRIHRELLLKVHGRAHAVEVRWLGNWRAELGLYVLSKEAQEERK
jgi:methionine biosynthesis protein MetW